MTSSDDTLYIELRRHADDADTRDLVEVSHEMTFLFFELGAHTQLTYYEAPAWQMRLYLHTLRCAIDDVPLPLLAADSTTSSSRRLRALRLVPSEHRGSPTQLEFVVALRAGERLSCNVSRRFCRRDCVTRRISGSI